MARLLLVEDNAGLQHFLRDLLRQEGHRADCVSTKAAAEAALQGSRYDLVIADVRLPDGSGHDIVALASASGVGTLLMSGHPDEITVLTVSGVDHLTKPFRVRDFIDALNRHLGI